MSSINNAVNASTAGFQSLTSGGVWNGRTLTAGTGISITNGDGTAGNPTITNTGGGSTSLSLVFDDFMGPGTLGGAAGGVGNSNLRYAAKTTETFFNTNGTATNPGILNMQLVASSTSAAALYGGLSDTAAGDIVLGGGQCTVEWIFRIPTLSTSSQRFFVRCGLGNNLNASASNTPNDGCWFEYVDNVNSGNWTINCKGNSGTTTNNTVNLVDTNFHSLKVIANAGATSVSFYIDGVQVSGSPITTNIPTDGVAFFIQLAKSVGSTAVSLYIDMLNFQISLTGSRY